MFSEGNCKKCDSCDSFYRQNIWKYIFKCGLSEWIHEKTWSVDVHEGQKVTNVIIVRWTVFLKCESCSM